MKKFVFSVLTTFVAFFSFSQTAYYVNDGSTAGDVFTSAVGNDANSGTSSAPLATIAAALTKVQNGDTVFVDAGTYATADLIISQSITILGANYLLSPNDAADKRTLNSVRNAESLVTGGTFVINNNNISIQGLTIDPLNNGVGNVGVFLNNLNYSNISVLKNRFQIKSNQPAVAFRAAGTASIGVASLVSTGFTVTDNRFEKYDGTNNNTIVADRVKNLTITDNAFVVAGSTLRTQVGIVLGNNGVVDVVNVSNNTLENLNGAIGGSRVANGIFNGNKIYNTNTALNFTNSIPETSTIEFSNNILDGSAGILPFVIYTRLGGNAVGANSLFKSENNTSTVNAIAGTTTGLGNYNINFTNTVLNPSLIIRANTMNFGGNLSTVEGQFLRPIVIRGKQANTIIEKNELTLSGTNLQPKNPSNILPVCPAISLYSDIGTGAILPSGGVINILNNKINGFKQSFVVFDPTNSASGGLNDYTGYGNLPGGVIVNINNNSFVGDSISINNGTVSENINATCNFYNTIIPEVLITKISPETGDYLPWLVNGTDNEPSTTGFQPVPGSCTGRVTKWYVNDANTAGDVFTTKTGDDVNGYGLSTLPFATMTRALAEAQAGDTIYVDAGTYTEQVTTDKGITIIGAGQNLTSILKPEVTVAPPGSFTEQGVIQTAQSITGDVHISNLSVSGGLVPITVTPIIIQSGGSVKNCKLQNGNQGIFVRVDPATNPSSKIFTIENNNISAEYIAVNVEGSKLTSSLINNEIAVNNPGFSTGVFAGLDFGANQGLTITGNKFSGYVTNALFIGALNTSVTQNSFTGAGTIAIQQVSGNTINATCNWYGSENAAVVIPKISGNITYSPWLSNGTDNDVASGFQPLPGVCNGRQNKFYVNDASQTGDVFTTAIGNNGNPGIPSAPLATISAAYLKASPGDTIYVDAGTYASVDGTIGKSITLLGANYLTNPNDGTNPLNAANRTAETIISNTTWTIGATDIRVKGFTFDPQAKTALAQTNNTLDYDNIEIVNNIFLVKSATTAINLLGKQQQPLVTFNYSITNNRFIKSVAGNGSNISMTGIDGILISGNTFATNNSAADWTQNAFTGAGFRTNNFVISNNTAYRTRFTYQNLNAIKAQVTNNKVYETTRFLLDFNGLNVPTEINITDNEVTIANSNGAPVLTYSRSNGTDVSAPNIARIERNTISADGTGWTLVPQALIAPTLDNVSANTQVYIRNNKLTISGNLSSLSESDSYVSAVRYLLNSRYTLVENNEIAFTATNYNGSNKFGIGVLHLGLQPGTSFNFFNNKISGFPTSIGVQNNANANNYGELPAGTVLNINNNSFTGDVMSINNGTTGQDASASCNWYGSAAVQNFINKLANVSVIPWLTSGTDTDAAIGFQPAPGACDGYPTLITLDNYSNVTCNGTANGTINITTTLGKASFTYTWTKEGDANFVSHDEDPTGLAPGTYTLSVTDGNGSNIYITDPQADGPGTIVVTITEPAVLTASANGTNNLCYGQANGSAAVTAGGGTEPYSYLWSNAGTADEITNLAAGIYSVTVTDANGCTASSSYEVTQPTQVTASIANASTACSNIATVNAGGGTPGYTYLWSNGATTATISGVPVGTYTVTVTDANGCIATAGINLTVAEAFNPTASVTNIACFGANNGIITVTNANGTAPFMFSKDAGVTFVPGTFPYNFTNLVPGTYTIAVKDANGCVGFIDRTVIQPTQLTASHTVQNTCLGSSTGSINVTVSGGTPAYSYSWTGPGGFTSTQLNISNLAAGDYYLTIKDKNNCTLVVPVTVSTYPAIVIAADIANISCKGNTNGSINITVTGGTGSGFTYSWTGTVVSSSEDLTNLVASTNYKLKVTDNGSGCTAMATYAITEPAAITISASKTNATSCALGTVNASGGGGTRPFLYSLNGGAYITDSVFTGLPAGNYTVTIKDANGCTKTSATLSITDNGSDAYESNNSKNQSKTIPVGTAINARIALATDVADWFKFVTNGAGSYTVTFNHPSAGFVYNVYPATNNAPALVPASTTATSKTYTLAAGTTYHISVTGGLSAVCYTLGVYDNSVITQRSTQKTDPAVVLEVNSITTSVFPNPHRGSFGIRIESPVSGEATVEIISITGQRVEQRKVTVAKGGNNIVRFNNMRSAALIYKVTMGKEVRTGKILGAD